MKHKTKVITAIILLTLGFMAAMVMLVGIFWYDHTSLTEEKEGEKQVYEKNLGLLKGTLDTTELNLEQTREVLKETESQLKEQLRENEVLTNNYNDLQDALEKEREEHKEEVVKLKKQYADASRDAYYGFISRAWRSFENGDVTLAKMLLEQCPSNLRNWEWGYLKYVCEEFTPGIRLEGSVPSFHDVSPQKKILCGEQDNEFIMIYSTDTGKLLRKFNKKSRESEYWCFSKDGEKLFGYDDTEIHEVWTTENWEYEKPSGKISPAGLAKITSVSPDGELWVQREGNTININSMKTEKLFRSLALPGRIVFADFLSDDTILSISKEGMLVQHEFRKFKTPAVLLPGEQVTGLFFISDKYVQIMHGPKRVQKIINLSNDRDLEPAKTDFIVENLVRQKADSPDGKRKAVCTRDIITIYDTDSKTPLISIKADEIHSIAFSLDGKKLAVATESGLKVYSARKW